MAKRNTNGRPSKADRNDSLSSFLGNVDRFAETVCKQIVGAAGDADEKLVIQSTAESFVAQMRRLTDYIRSAAATTTALQRRELEQFLSVQDGEALIERALRITAQTLSSGGGGAVTQGFLSWLNENLMTIK